MTVSKKTTNAGTIRTKNINSWIVRGPDVFIGLLFNSHIVAKKNIVKKIDAETLKNLMESAFSMVNWRFYF
jgi:hypothetical protein